MKQELIYDLHAEHKEWLNKLAFYSDDIKIMTKRLEEVASKNTKEEVMSLVEHFQNMLIIQKENIDILKHEINEHEEYLQRRLSENAVAADKRKINDHPKHREAIEGFETSFNKLRKEFIDFVAKWM
jgi:hypothetical protein